MIHEHFSSSHIHPKRWHGLDLIRLISFIAIIYHHFTLQIWYPEPPPSSSFWGFDLLTLLTRIIPFSGLTVGFLFAALSGIQQKTLKAMKKPFFLMLLGWSSFLIFEWSTGKAPIFLIWDVYPLLFIGILTSVLYCQNYYEKAYDLILAGIIMLSVSFWKIPFFATLPLALSQVLVGSCEMDLADWPILPWIGLVWLGYGIGFSIKRIDALNLTIRELVIWFTFLFLSWPFAGSYFSVPFGSKFACFVFRQNPFHFLCTMLWPCFLMRIALDPNFQAYLEKVPTIKWICNLKISRHFGLAYLVHQGIIRILYIFYAPLLKSSIELSFWVCICILPTTELLIRILVRLQSFQVNPFQRYLR